MAHLIDKDAALAKIDGEIKLLEPYLGACAGQIVAEANSKIAAYNRVKDILDTIEVKEVDYDKEVTEYLNNFKNANIGHRLSLRRCAKHFFELGLNAQKGK